MSLQIAAMAGLATLLFVQDPRDETGRAAQSVVWTGGQVEWLGKPRPDRHLNTSSIPINVPYAANLDCEIQRRGRLGDCLVAWEAPNDINFGRAAARGASAARIKLVPDGPQPGHRLVFAVTLMMEEY